MHNFIVAYEFRKIFGNLTEIRGDKYASTIDSAPSNVFLIIHIYDEVRRNHNCKKLVFFIHIL